MIYTVNISNQAETDLREIYEYIAYELQSPENASGQWDRLEKCILSLSQKPERFRIYDAEPWKSRGLRIVPVNNYCVFYIPILFILSAILSGFNLLPRSRRGMALRLFTVRKKGCSVICFLYQCYSLALSVINISRLFNF